MVDQRRFEQVWQAHGAAVLRYCRFTSGCELTGEDLATETFVRFLEKGEHIPDAKVEAWLFTVARNLCISHHRRTVRWNALMPKIAAVTPTQEDPVEFSEDPLPAMLAPLNERQRLAVFLKVVEDRPISEVSRVVGMKEGACRKLIERALHKLRGSMTHVQKRSSAQPQGGVERVRSAGE